jgi:hypothetical protein
MPLTDFQTQNGGAEAFQFANGAGFDASGNPIAAPARYTNPSNGAATIPANSSTPVPASTPAASASPATDPNAPTLAPVDENAIRENARQGMQASIDAINANYANLITQENQNGQERTGETRAINARSGLMGSDFGAAADTKTQQFNQQQVKSLQDEQNAKIQAVQQNIEDRASAEIESQRTYNLNKYQADESVYEKNQAAAKADLQTLAASGTKLDSLNPDQKAALFKQAGYSDPAMGEVIYNAMLPKAAQIDYKSENLGNGTVLFYGMDPTTGQLKTQKVSVDMPMDASLTIAPDGTPLIFDKTKGTASIAPGFTKGEFAKSDSSSSTGGAGSYQPGANPTVDSWVTNVAAGTAKLSDVPNNLLNSVSQGLAATHGSADDIVATTKQSLQELQTMVDNNQGFTSAVGAKGLSSFFGIKGSPLAGSAAANFDAKLKQVVNDVVLPNLKVLHGLGRVTDREFQALSNSVTALGTNLSETQFKTELKDITDRVNQAQNATPQGVSVQTPDGQTHTFPDQKSADAFKQAAGIK